MAMKIWIKPEYEITPRIELLRRGDRRRYHQCYELSEKRVATRNRYTKTEAFKRSQERYIASEKGKKSRAKTLKEWYAKNREAKRAHNIINKALGRGRIKRQPCEVCGSLKSHAHHSDYLRPLEVEWLCAVHHKERHPKVRVKK